MVLAESSFSLFSEDPDQHLESMNGLEFPYTAEFVTQENKNNLLALVLLLKKCRRLEIHKLSHAWPVLVILNKNPGKFSKIRGFSIKYWEEFADLIENIPE